MCLIGIASREPDQIDETETHQHRAGPDDLHRRPYCFTDDTAADMDYIVKKILRLDTAFRQGDNRFPAGSG